MLPQTDIHKIIGFLVAIAFGYALKFGLNVPADVQASITLGLSILISTLIGKRTNPTGANTSEARHKLEHSIEGPALMAEKK